MRIDKNSLGAKVLKITKMKSDDRFVPRTYDPNFKNYAELIMVGDIKSAGEILSILFKVNKKRAHQCALFNADFYVKEPSAMQLLMQTRYMIKENNLASAKIALAKCFGLDTFESTYVIRNLKV
ncbi:MAG: hypothetical protein KDD58_03850 [Bdellovibrionales bacterium]|nr:hypothetical protein [Bdellovibrionales bacterium]